MTIATPFNKPRAFYYNTKINCMKAEGYCVVKGNRYDFGKNDSLGTLDWGRGVWTYKNTWYWSSLQTYLDDGRPFGFNLGYGFGDTSKASENMLFVDGKSHKLNKVQFEIPQKKRQRRLYVAVEITRQRRQTTVRLLPNYRSQGHYGYRSNCVASASSVRQIQRDCRIRRRNHTENSRQDRICGKGI